MVKLIKADFDGHVMQFNDAGWFNATDAAKTFGKDVHEWTRLQSTSEYIMALSRKYGQIPYLEIGRGVDRETRKEILVSMAGDSRIKVSSISAGVE